MKIIIEINIDNAAFENEEFELNRILKELSEKIINNNISYPHRILDINGNFVGFINKENL